MDKTYFIIPAYNESEAIQQVLEEWYPVVEHCGQESRLVVIDDGSRDNTYAILTEFAQTHPQVMPVTKPNGGHGATILYGYRYALQQGADYIFRPIPMDRPIRRNFPHSGSCGRNTTW